MSLISQSLGVRVMAAYKIGWHAEIIQERAQGAHRKRTINIKKPHHCRATLVLIAGGAQRSIQFTHKPREQTIEKRLSQCVAGIPDHKRHKQCDEVGPETQSHQRSACMPATYSASPFFSWETIFCPLASVVRCVSALISPFSSMPHSYGRGW